ncbi:acyl-CoA carboxylase subunit epsilon [Ornithinimicrobium sp. Y1847]|uniref:acyl-CoA carboxylase subunit epsilon n=1 Tax=unclassified Ornithinimicrobium TaxID=2615080 RepID=UPI003B67DF98
MAVPPVIRVERGNPTPEQVAALTLVLTAAAQGGDGGQAGRAPRTLWTARSRFARPRPAVGPGGWRASALPR